MDHTSLNIIDINMSKKKIRNICCIGAGYVGGPTMAVIAYKSPEVNVNVVDISEERINQWNEKDLSKLPIFEPGLAEIVDATRGKNLFFSSEIDKAIDSADMIFISVNTPTKTYGIGKGQSSDLKYVELCARNIAKVAKDDKIVVEKSTLPVRTADTIKKILHNSDSDVEFEILSNPEFLAEGTAIDDLLNADRVLIGGESNQSGQHAIKLLSSIYENWIPKEKIITTNLWSSELSKLVANAFLAQRVSSINSVSVLCEKTEANVDEVSKAIGLDSRIGSKFLKSSVGFGGSCFKKDILNLVYIAKSYGLDEVAQYWEQVVLMNEYQKNRFTKKIINTLFNTVSGKNITIFGWAFKKDTNDTRESAAIKVADELIDENAILKIYDPKVSKDKILSDLNSLGSRDPKVNQNSIFVYNNPYDAVKKSHAVAILTEWDEFVKLDYIKIFQSMIKPSFIFDGRRIVEKNELEKIGFKVYKLGE